ncbi:hypothetical protein FDECE_2717 [Fusarium decemcellulare]|nr:hypothetical protein FDECE_2717 [Fusarium decemcellulare]
MRGEHTTLINHLIQENNDLRASLNRYQAQKEEAALHEREYLEDQESCPNDELVPPRNAQYGQFRFDQASSQPHHSMGESKQATGFDLISPSPFHFLQSFNQTLHHSSAFTMSIIFQAASLVLPSVFDQTVLPLTRKEWIQSILMWKIVNSHASNCYFLLSHFNLEREPTCLSIGTNLSGTISDSNLARNRDSTIDANEEQRRAILFCAFKLVNPWRKYYKSAVEFGLVFWAIYRYFVLLTFPTEENLKATPSWILPTPSQMLREHPGYVDFLIWPHLRERLCLTWGHYDEKRLVLQLITNFEIPIEARKNLEIGFPLRLAQEDGKVQLRPQFRTIFEKMGGFRTKLEFGINFPELMPYVFPSGAAIAQFSSESSQQSQALTWVDLESRCTTPVQETLDLDYLRDSMVIEPPERSVASDSAENSSIGGYTSEAPVSDGASPKHRFATDEILSSSCSSKKVTEAAIGKAYEDFCNAFAPFPPFTSVSHKDLF